MRNLINLELALRSLQLPIDPSRENDALESLIEYAEESNYSPNDLAIIIERELASWMFSGAPGQRLMQVVAIILESRPPEIHKLDGRSYFEVHNRLRAGTSFSAGLSHVAAQRLLSRSSLIVHLLRNEKFSCSQVARTLQATDTSLDVPYGAVSTIARALGSAPSLDLFQVDTILWTNDSNLALTLFPDSNIYETNLAAALEIEIWLPGAEFISLLNRLVDISTNEAEPTWPYLQMLHWCLAPIEFHDHPASYLYEFSPRGNVAQAIFNKYQIATGNPVLNNAKAVETLNTTWAKNRGGDDAHALVKILSLIESLPFVPRQQVARVLRAWLIRIIELRTVKTVTIDPFCSTSDAINIAHLICNNETYSQGVIEQRIVDFLSVLIFSEDDWRPHGVGDGVNASNLSRKKLGDIEFARVDQRMAVALEAHGGYLSKTYVEDHQRSLARIIEQRLDESWANLDAPSAWTIKVLFVAHTRDESDLPAAEVIHGVNVKYEYIDYQELLDRALADVEPNYLLKTFNLLVIDILNAHNVRESTRDRFRELYAQSLVLNEK